MTLLSRLSVTLCAALLLAAPAAHAGGIDLTDRLEDRLREGVAEAHAAETPAAKRLALSNAFRSMSDALERAEGARGLSDAEAATLAELQRKITERHNRLNGLNGFAPVPSTDLDRFATDVQSNLLDSQTITIGLGTALLVVIIIILLV